MSMEDLLQALMGGAGAPQRRGQSGSDPLADMLQQILGSGSAQAGGGGLEDILGAIMGGGAAQGASQGAQGGGLMDILGAILGGTGAGATGGAGLSPIAEGIAAKLGLPPAIAQMIVAFVIGKLLGGTTGGAGGALAPTPGAAPRPSGRSTGPAQPAQGFDLDSLLETMGQDENMAAELAQQTGLDAQTAQRGLQEVLGMLGAGGRGQAGPSDRPKSGGLDSLLDTW